MKVGWLIYRGVWNYPWNTTGTVNDGTVYQSPAQSYIFTKRTNYWIWSSTYWCFPEWMGMISIKTITIGWYSNPSPMNPSSMDWCKGKFPGKPKISWENPWFPLDFPKKTNLLTSERCPLRPDSDEPRMPSKRSVPAIRCSSGIPSAPRQDPRFMRHACCFTSHMGDF